MVTTREKDRDAACAYYNARELAYRDDFLDACAHRDKQTIAFLRNRSDMAAKAGAERVEDALRWAADAIERGEHVP